MRRAIGLLGILMILGLALQAQEPRQRAYDLGYRAGYDQGYSDARTGLASNVSRSTVYRDATLGWSGAQLSPDEYRDNFRTGFVRGYDTGYSDVAMNAPANPASRVPYSPQAYDNGYRIGYGQGRQAADVGAFSLESNRAFQDATAGYDPVALVPLVQYRTDFRDGFRMGYSDAYYGRAYNQTYGANAAAPPAGTGYPYAYGAGSYSNTVTGLGSGYNFAFNNGYREGLILGARDAGRAYRAARTDVYRTASFGYDPARDGTADSYRRQFRQGFIAGYDTAYFGSRQ